MGLSVILGLLELTTGPTDLLNVDASAGLDATCLPG